MSVQYKIDVKTAIKLVRKLIKKPHNTIFLFQLLHATNAPSLKWAYKKLLETEHGGKIAYNSEEVYEYFPTLRDRPEGSVGKHCHEMFPNQELLIKISKRKSNDTWIEAKHPYNWMARRYRDTHDTWHILTGYDTTILGEMCLAMFSFAQTKSLGWLLISFIGFAHRGMKLSDIGLIRKAYLRGKDAKFLLAENYDALFDEGITAARTRLGL